MKDPTNGDISYGQMKQELTYLVLMAEIMYDVHRTRNLCHNTPKKRLCMFKLHNDVETA